MLVAELPDLIGVHLGVLFGYELGVPLHLHDHEHGEVLLGVLHAEELERLLVPVQLGVDVDKDHLAAHLPRRRTQRLQARIVILNCDEKCQYVVSSIIGCRFQGSS